MEKYVIYKQESPTSKKFIYVIYRNSISDSKDLGDAIEYDNKDIALKMCEYLNTRERENFKVMCIKTTIEEDIQ